MNTFLLVPRKGRVLIFMDCSLQLLTTISCSILTVDLSYIRSVCGAGAPKLVSLVSHVRYIGLVLLTFKIATLKVNCSWYSHPINAKNPF